MQDGFDLSVIVFLVLAAFVGWRLYSVLGTRTERDAEPTVSRFRPVAVNKPVDSPISDEKLIEGEVKPAADPTRWRGIADPESPLATSLDRVVEVEPSFDARHFLSGGRAAYEAIVLAFASGDRSTLKDLLSRDVFESFTGVIAERESKGETVETTFVGLDKVEIKDAQIRGKSIQITVKFLSKLITATLDAKGEIIEGATDKVIDVNDVWTFARDIGSRDPAWKLIATEAAQ
jgi:predicted lipid-binding transport protein (Tim44 family)